MNVEWKNQQVFDTMAAQDQIAREQRNIMHGSLDFREPVEVTPKPRMVNGEMVVYHYFGHITDVQLESGLIFPEGKDYNIQISSNPGLWIYVDLRVPGTIKRADIGID